MNSIIGTCFCLAGSIYLLTEQPIAGGILVVASAIYAHAHATAHTERTL